VNGAAVPEFPADGPVVSNDAQLYALGSGTMPSLYRVNPDGSGLQPLVSQVAAPPCGRFDDLDAIALDGAHVNWADGLAGTIGRANLDGSQATDEFVNAAGGDCGTVAPGSRGPAGAAVDGTHVYWTNPDQDTIGRANLDGSGVTQTFITGALYPTGIAVEGSNPTPYVSFQYTFSY
jgi:hypothetical protein